MSKIITVLSKSACAPCEALKTYLKTNGIEFTDLNAFDHPEIMTKLRLRKVPSVTITEVPVLEAIQLDEAPLELITGDNVLGQLQAKLGV